MNTEYQFESTEQRARKIAFDVRVNGLNQLAKIRQQHLKAGNEQLKSFIDEMRNKRNKNYGDNIRVLAAIFFLANIKKERHGLELNQFSIEERSELIKAINKIKASAPLLPTGLSLPN
ncbi:DUF5347 family protein [Xenorhabdus griffiniae]|uniref:DUF5347 family protein n=2 Tax=Xenorhabdus griffiniae TaxID=351672 RepID=A0ABY9XL26_9GAMM|nr:DUF5347 family protein [Xenorhabdus griffiniae]MBE8589231.1 DUF5347 domain-containing protein [Xenorhabdus griffiniae]WMV73641.1 DUF5347 family protein [Xenorhabdus griffiniae]WNH03321.1 DUF5347 family protein [Xenorhabdus griffiniae]